MIKFFRKIRRNLLSEGKTGKYLKYAIGEIILVMIGIILALQFNNWNERRKIALEETVLIKGLIQNIEQDIVNFRDLIESNKQYIIANKNTLSAFKTDTIREDKRLLMTYILGGTTSASFVPTQTIYNEMKFSGKVNYILNDSINTQIQKYYDGVSQIIEVQTSNKKLMHELSVSTMYYVDLNSLINLVLPEYAKIELDAFDNSFFYEPLKSDKVKEFANLISIRQYLMSSIVSSFEYGLNKAITLKQNMNEYLVTK